MTEIFITLLITKLSFVLYMIARRQKVLFSGKNYSRLKLAIALTYNVSIMVFYYEYLTNFHIPIYGQMESIFLLSLAIIMFFMHASAVPTKWKARCWNFNKRFDFKVRKHQLALNQYRKAKKNNDQ